MPRQKTLTSGIARIGVVERDLAADRGDADAVAVPGDAGDDAFDDAAVARAVGPVERPEAQRVHERDGPRAHREDVPDDAADAGGRALVRLDERGMIVGLDLEDRGEAVADVHRARVLARALQDTWSGGRQLPQVDARALVAAVLGPHHREDAELGQRRFALHRPNDAFVLVRLEAVALENSGVDGAHGVVTRSGGRSARSGRRSPTRTSPVHLRCRAPLRTRARDGASSRPRCGLRCRCRRCC